MYTMVDGLAAHGGGAVVFMTKSDQAYDVVRSMIVTCELEPGSAINQVALARDLGLSTTPLREALRRLKTEGWVQLDAHRDARVAPLSQTEAKHLFDLRLELDPYAVGLAAEHRGGDRVEAMRKALRDLEPINETVGGVSLRAHADFHRAVYEASDNPILASFLTGLWDKAERYRRHGIKLLAGSGEARHADLREHFEMFDLIVAGQVPEARALMRHHIESSLGKLSVHHLAAASPLDPPPATSGPSTR
jgi:DNA-binding GntR family transcriptional regulator